MNKFYQKETRAFKILHGNGISLPFTFGSRRRSFWGLALIASGQAIAFIPRVPSGDE